MTEPKARRLYAALRMLDTVERRLRAAQAELACGEPVQSRHLAWMIDATGEAMAYLDRGLAQTATRLLECWSMLVARRHPREEAPPEDLWRRLTADLHPSLKFPS